MVEGTRIGMEAVPLGGTPDLGQHLDAVGHGVAVQLLARPLPCKRVKDGQMVSRGRAIKLGLSVCPLPGPL